LCKNDSKCHWITYNEAKSSCLLFEDCETLDESEEGVYISSERRCELEQESTTIAISTTTTATTEGLNKILLNMVPFLT